MTKQKKCILILAAAIIALAAASQIIWKQGDAALNEAYVIERISQFSGQQSWKTEIGEGDVILEKWFGFFRLPAGLDRVKPVEKEKLTNQPQKTPERLLRIKELGEDGAVVAILHQSIYYEGELRVIEEYETLRSVSFGEVFSVYMKQRVMDAPTQPMHDFVIYRKNDPVEPWRPAPTEPPTALPDTAGGAFCSGAFFRCCIRCGNKAYYDDAAKPPRYCPECGNRF